MSLHKKQLENPRHALSRAKMRGIVKAVDILLRVNLDDHLGMKNQSAKWVPRLRTIDRKLDRVTTSEECLALLNRNMDEFMCRLTTVNETWIHDNTPETKQRSKLFLKESVMKKPKVELSPKKSKFDQNVSSSTPEGINQREPIEH